MPCLNAFGPIIDVDTAKPPYGNSRRLTTNLDVGGSAKRAHGIVTPAKDDPLFEDVWRYLFTHSVDQVGAPVAIDPACVVK